ncbi:MAG: rod shape-determining protein MreD [Streptococcaceae bacterium]|jgi:rod shape-determining protein MreD|nr:rod shape-determining protein MreD [Streptococcaceae bacterium]
MQRYTFEFLDPILLFLLLLADSHLSQFLSALTGNLLMPVTHLSLIVLMYSVTKHRLPFLMSVTVALGLIYDSYFIGVLGLASALFPLAALFLYEIREIVYHSRWTRVVSGIIVVFVFETLLPTLEVLFGLAHVSLAHFVTYQLAPTLLVNILLTFLLLWPLEKLYNLRRIKEESPELLEN